MNENISEVFITPTGKKFHKENCSTVKPARASGKLVAMKIEELANTNFTACSICLIGFKIPNARSEEVRSNEVLSLKNKDYKKSEEKKEKINERINLEQMNKIKFSNKKIPNNKYKENKFEESNLDQEDPNRNNDLEEQRRKIEVYKPIKENKVPIDDFNQEDRKNSTKGNLKAIKCDFPSNGIYNSENHQLIKKSDSYAYVISNNFEDVKKDLKQKFYYSVKIKNINEKSFFRLGYRINSYSNNVTNSIIDGNDLSDHSNETCIKSDFYWLEKDPKIYKNDSIKVIIDFNHYAIFTIINNNQKTISEALKIKNLERNYTYYVSPCVCLQKIGDTLEYN